MDKPKKERSEAARRVLVKTLLMPPEKREQFLRMQRLRHGLPVAASSSEPSPHQLARPDTELPETAGAPQASAVEPYPLPAERLDLGDESPLRTFSPPPPYLAVKPEPAGAGDEPQPFDAGALIGRVADDKREPSGSAPPRGPAAPKLPRSRPSAWCKSTAQKS